MIIMQVSINFLSTSFLEQILCWILKFLKCVSRRSIGACNLLAACHVRHQLHFIVFMSYFVASQFPFRKCCKIVMRFDACSTHQCHAVVKRTLKFCLYHSSSQKGYRQFADYFRTLNLAK